MLFNILFDAMGVVIVVCSSWHCSCSIVMFFVGRVILNTYCKSLKDKSWVVIIVDYSRDFTVVNGL